jgi:hypothetical protein
VTSDPAESAKPNANEIFDAEKARLLLKDDESARLESVDIVPPRFVTGSRLARAKVKAMSRTVFQEIHVLARNYDHYSVMQGWSLITSPWAGLARLGDHRRLLGDEPAPTTRRPRQNLGFWIRTSHRRGITPDPYSKGGPC